MEAGKREQIMQIMREHRIDIMAIQETKVSTSSEETKVQEKTGDKFKFIFSSNAQEQHPRSVQIIDLAGTQTQSQKQKPRQQIKLLNIMEWVLL